MLDTIVSLSLVPVIRSIVELVKPAWQYIPEHVQPVINTVVSCLVGVLVSCVWSISSGDGKQFAVVIANGILSGFGATLYHDIRKSME